jgi:hypothetical protein
MPLGGGKTLQVHAATSAGLFCCSLPDGGVAPVGAAAPASRLVPAALFAREPSELLVCLSSSAAAATSPARQDSCPEDPAGELVQLT